MRPIVALLPGMLLVLLLPGASRLALAQDTRLTGKWVLNEDESEDPRTKFQQAVSAAGRSDGSRGGRGRGRGMRGGGKREQMQQTMQMLMEASLRLNIVQDDSTVTIVGAEGTRLVLYPDGRKIEYPIEGVGTVETKAGWKGDKLVVERKMEGGRKVTRTYELASEGQQMYVNVRFEGGQLQGPVDIRRVYDVAAEGN